MVHANILMDANNARTGQRTDGEGEGVMKIHGHDELNENGRLPLTFAAEKTLSSLTNTFFHGISRASSLDRSTEQMPSQKAARVHFYEGLGSVSWVTSDTHTTNGASGTDCKRLSYIPSR